VSHLALVPLLSFCKLFNEGLRELANGVILVQPFADSVNAASEETGRAGVSYCVVKEETVESMAAGCVTYLANALKMKVKVLGNRKTLFSVRV
jgi:hypothetical protein